MAQRDIYHHTVIAALAKDGWRITDDPLVLKWGQKDLYIDLGAEELVAAEKSGRQIDRLPLRSKASLAHPKLKI